MFSRFSIQTRLSSVEAEEILRRLVRPNVSFFKPDPTTIDARPFVGRVGEGSFKFHRVITGRNSFLPITSGHIVQAEGGAVVRGQMRLAVAVAVVMTLWMGMTVTAAVKELPKEIAEHNITEAISLAFFPLFGAVLIAVGYYPERRKVLRLLSDAFFTH